MEFGLFVEFPYAGGLSDQEAFAQSFALVDEAENLGVDAVWLPEYHFSPVSVLSSPIAVAAAIAARTQKVRIGMGVLCLPLGNPLRFAEDGATLDHISQGRLDFGIGRGTFPDHHDAFNSPYLESRGRFEEYLEVIIKAWTMDEFSFDGEHYHCDTLRVTPKPFQKPHPPISIGATSAETFPIVGRMGYPIIVNPSRAFALRDLAPYMAEYRQAWREAGHEGDGSIGLRVPVYVAETEEEAYHEPMESTASSIVRLGERVAGSASRAGTSGNWREQAAQIMSMTYDDWLRDKVLYGTPESVAERLQGLIEELGLSQIIYEINFGRRIPYEHQLKCLRLLTERVLVHFK